MIENFANGLSIAEAIKNDYVSAEDILDKTYRQIEEKEEGVSAFAHIDYEHPREVARGIDRTPKNKRGSFSKLTGLPIAVKDNIVTKDQYTTAASKVLENWLPPYDANVVKLLKQHSVPIIGKTNLDEFAMGSSTANSIHGKSFHSKDRELSPGGSSGGSAAAVQSGEVYLALGSDTGGSVRQPAALCGIFGYKPTYGAISRYGLIAFASSLDQIGILSRDINDLIALYNLLAQRDTRDQTSSIFPRDSSLRKKLKIGIIDNYYSDQALDPEIKETLNIFVKEKLRHYDAELVSSKYFDGLLELYKIISYAEAFSNLNRYDGHKYGKAATTSQNVNEYRQLLGEEVRKRVDSGNLLLAEKRKEHFYKRANILRRQLTHYMSGLFEKYSLLLSPTLPERELRIGAVMDDNRLDKYTVLGNLTSLPAISIPVGSNNIGLQFYSNKGEDAFLLNSIKIIYERD